MEPREFDASIPEGESCETCQRFPGCRAGFNCEPENTVCYFDPSLWQLSQIVNMERMIVTTEQMIASGTEEMLRTLVQNVYPLLLEMRERMGDRIVITIHGSKKENE